MSPKHLSTESLLYYLDRELDAAEQSAAHEHLAECAECRASLAAVRSVSSGIDEYSAELLMPARRAQRRELCAALDGTQPARAPRMYAALALAASVLLAVSFSISTHRSPHVPPTAAQPAADTFIALPYSNENLTGDGGVVMRVEVPRSAVTLAGAPAGEGPLKAEVLVGADGLARAIRFVN
jgi:anti-sigma factor RsiW